MFGFKLQSENKPPWPELHSLWCKFTKSTPLLAHLTAALHFCGDWDNSRTSFLMDNLAKDDVKDIKTARTCASRTYPHYSHYRKCSMWRYGRNNTHHCSASKAFYQKCIKLKLVLSIRNIRGSELLCYAALSFCAYQLPYGNTGTAFNWEVFLTVSLLNLTPRRQTGALQHLRSSGILPSPCQLQSHSETEE